MAAHFFGRERELEEFRQLMKKPTSSLVVCQGRRRIGKSTFFKHAAKDADHFLQFEGLAPRSGITKQVQLDAFAQRLATQTRAPKLELTSWPQAFQLLSSLLPTSGWTVLLLDEISWMATGEPDFAGQLKVAWDSYFSNRSRLIVVLCGSVSSWIETNILQSTGFVGRTSWTVQLPPLPLPACNQFWRGKSVSALEKLKVLSVTGGVPRYLEEMDPAQTAEQTIERLCFHPGGPLFKEFDQIFHDIFSGRAATYRQIVMTLVTDAKTVTDISGALGQEKGGGLSAALADLELAGFVCRDVSFDPETGKSLPRTLRYRILDNYLRFYLKYVDPVREQIQKGLFQWTPLESLSAWDTIIGLQFEALILSNTPLLLEKIGLGNVEVLNAGPYFQAKTKQRDGCQIDLLVRTKGSLYVFELKVRKHITASVIDEVRTKVDRLKIGFSLSVRTGLIYQGELDPNIAKSDYFDRLVPFQDLLRNP
jgi:hypothetical protein